MDYTGMLEQGWRLWYVRTTMVAVGMGEVVNGSEILRRQNLLDLDTDVGGREGVPSVEKAKEVLLETSHS